MQYICNNIANEIGICNKIEMILPKLMVEADGYKKTTLMIQDAGAESCGFLGGKPKALRIHMKDIRFVHKMYGRFQTFDFPCLTGFYRFFQKGMTVFWTP